MKLIEIYVRDSVRGKDLGDGAFYLRLEQKDVLSKLKLAGTVDANELVGMVRQSTDDFTRAAEHISSMLKELAGEESIIEDPVQAWLSDSSGFCFCKRILLKKAESKESVFQVIEEIKKKLIEDEMYLVVRDCTK